MQSTLFATILMGLSVMHAHPPHNKETVAMERNVQGQPSKGNKSAEPKKANEQMKMNQPMPAGMAKPGMKQGDVKKAADAKEAKLNKMMNEEMK